MLKTRKRKGDIIMNLYDKAHEMARMLKQTAEFQEFVKVQQQVEQDPQAMTMLKDFFKKQWEVQSENMRGTPNQESQNQLSRMYDVMQHNSVLKEFFAAEMKFGRLVTDIQGIMAQAISEGCQLVGKLQDEN